MKRLYFSARISDYQFRSVLWQYTLDRSALEAARHIRLSSDSIGAIYSKLRVFFFDYGLFGDPYKGGDQREGLPWEGFENAERALLAFHRQRVSAKRGQIVRSLGAPDYHLAESYWRFDFETLKNERGPAAVHRAMQADLLEFIRRFGPVGQKRKPSPEQRHAGLTLALEQARKHILWFDRNSPLFRDPIKRGELRRLRGD